MKGKVVAIVEARMGSTRLPKKTLMDVEGKALLERVVDRITLSKTIHEVVIATSTNKGDDPIDTLCKERKIPCFRGSEEDVLCRVYNSAARHKADIIVQSGADCPFYDPDLIDILVNIMKWGGYHYTANDMELTFPEGIDAHIIRFNALEESAKEAKKEDEREDTPRFIWNHPERYSIFNLVAVKDSYYNRPDIRLTIDYPEDMMLCKKIYQVFADKPDFTTAELIKLLDDNPEWQNLNKHCEQNSAAYVKE